MAKIELEIGYDKSINRETRILGVGDNLYYVSQEMEQYKDGYTITDINPLTNTVTFTNGETISTCDVVGGISEKDTVVLMPDFEKLTRTPLHILTLFGGDAEI